MEEIIFLDASTVGSIPEVESFKDFGNLTCYGNSTPGEALERVKTASIVLTNKVVLDKKVLDAAPSLRLICITATGTNNVDLAYAKSKGIVVKNVEDYSTQSVTQVTFGALLHLLNRIAYYDHFVKSGAYSQSALFTDVSRPFWQIHGKVFGIIGLGRIGREVAKVAQAFGARVIYYSTSGKNTQSDYTQVELPELLQTSDIVSIHAPLNDQTKNLIDYKRMAHMKKTSILINAGRGGIVSEPDLARALDEDIIFAAALDVMVQEPLASDHPLLHLKNMDKILITPHIAWASIESRKTLMNKTYQNIKIFLLG